MKGNIYGASSNFSNLWDLQEHNEREEGFQSYHLGSKPHISEDAM